MHFTEYDTRLAGYAVIIDDADHILLSWFNGGRNWGRPGWSLPGGGVDLVEIGIRARLSVAGAAMPAWPR